jgi:hypothetical protein
MWAHLLLYAAILIVAREIFVHASHGYLHMSICHLLSKLSGEARSSSRADRAAQLTSTPAKLREEKKVLKTLSICSTDLVVSSFSNFA